MENIVRIEDIPDFVERTIAAVRDGIALVRKAGVLAELPKEIQFDMTVIGIWQSPDLAVVTTDSSTGNDTGSSISTQIGIGSVVSHDEGRGNGTSVSASISDSTDTGTGSSTQQSAGSRGGTETSTSTSDDTSTSNGSNGSYTYNT
jgi:hypothetical protein